MMRAYRRPTGTFGPGVHPLLRRLWTEMAAQRVSQEDVAERSGVSSSAMRKWRNATRKPNLPDLEACFNALGYELTIREILD